MNKFVRRGLVTAGVLLTSISLVGCGSSNHMSHAKLNSMPRTSRTAYMVKKQSKERGFKVAKKSSTLKHLPIDKNTSVNGKAGKKYTGAKASTGLDGFVYKKSNNTLYVINSKKMANASYSDTRSAKAYMKRANKYTNSRISGIMSRVPKHKLNIVSSFN